MKSHDFTESTYADEYKRTIYCRKCGKVAWNYNWSEKLNADLQSKIGNCIEEDIIKK